MYDAMVGIRGIFRLPTRENSSEHSDFQNYFFEYRVSWHSESNGNIPVTIFRSEVRQKCHDANGGIMHDLPSSAMMPAWASWHFLNRGVPCTAFSALSPMMPTVASRQDLFQSVRFPHEIWLRNLCRIHGNQGINVFQNFFCR